jgi:RNA-directed DNA polymerase
MIVERSDTSAEAESSSSTDHLLEWIVERDNLNRAWKRVLANKGAGGIDGMSVDDLFGWCRDHGKELVASLLDGTYQPSPVRGVEIAKPGGGRRQLGIPTVVDRLIQQAILQVLGPVLDEKFSESSFGFRPGRSAHDALEQSSHHVQDGYGYVVDVDLEQYFDRVNHDKLMARLARHVDDKRLLKLIRRFLQAGLMRDGVVHRREEGTPQGGPLSPLLSNLYLDDFDKELEKRGHRFVRYADDCTIFVRSQRAGERVVATVTDFLERKLKLRVNREKTAVGHVSERTLLGYRLFPGRQFWDLPEEPQPF